MTRDLHFDAATHRYSVNGAALPAVTHILGPVWPYAGVDSAVLNRKAAIGAAAHRAIELDCLGRLNMSSLHPAVAPYFDAWTRFRAQAQYEAVAHELRVWHPALRYAGTLDAIGWLNGEPALIDYKCTSSIMPTVGPQTAAYKEAAMNTPDIDPAFREFARDARRWCLQLREDGTYRLVSFDDPNDLRVFLALLTVHTFRLHHADYYPVR